MLRISLQTLRARRGTLAGAFVAIWLAVTLASATGLLMAGALGPPGAGRLAATDAVVRADPTVTIGHGEDAEGVDVIPAPRLRAEIVERATAVPGVARAVGDIAFPAGAWNAQGQHLDAERADRLVGHGWDSAALTPYRLTAGRQPSGRNDVVADVRLGTRVGALLRVVTPAGDARYRVSGLADAGGVGDESQAAVFFAPAVAAALSGAPGQCQCRRCDRRARDVRGRTARPPEGAPRGSDRGPRSRARRGCRRRRPDGGGSCGADRHLRRSGRHRRCGCPVRGRWNVRPCHRPAPARDRRAACSGRDPTADPPADRRRSAARVAGGRRVGRGRGPPVRESHRRRPRRSRRGRTGVRAGGLDHPARGGARHGCPDRAAGRLRRSSPGRAHRAGRRASRGRDRTSAARIRPRRRRRRMSARRRGDVDAVLRLLGDGLRGPRRDPARNGHGTPRALAARHPGRRARGAAASSRRGGDARRHRPGGEPLAHRGLGDADPARGDARRNPGNRRVQQSAPHRGRDAPSRPCATRRRRRRRSAPACRHRRRGRATRRRRCRDRRRADRAVPARRRTR